MRVVLAQTDGFSALLAEAGRLMVAGRDFVPILHLGFDSQAYDRLVQDTEELHLVVHDPGAARALVVEGVRLAREAGIAPVLWIEHGSFPHSQGVQEPVPYGGDDAGVCEDLVLSHDGTVLRIPTPVKGRQEVESMLQQMGPECDHLVMDVAPARTIVEKGTAILSRGGILSVAVAPPLSVLVVSRTLGVERGEPGLLSRWLSHGCGAAGAVVRVPSEGGAIDRDEVLALWEGASDG